MIRRITSKPRVYRDSSYYDGYSMSRPVFWTDICPSGTEGSVPFKFNSCCVCIVFEQGVEYTLTVDSYSTYFSILDSEGNVLASRETYSDNSFQHTASYTGIHYVRFSSDSPGIDVFTRTISVSPRPVTFSLVGWSSPVSSLGFDAKTRVPIVYRSAQDAGVLCDGFPKTNLVVNEPFIDQSSSLYEPKYGSVSYERHLGVDCASIVSGRGIITGDYSLPELGESRTVSFWFCASGSVGCFFSFGENTYRYTGFTLSWSSSSLQLKTTSNDSSSKELVADMPLYDGEWHHVMLEFDGSKTTITLDGSKTAEWQYQLYTVPCRNLVIGGYSDSNYSSSFRIARLRVYSGLLSQHYRSKLLAELSPERLWPDSYVVLGAGQTVVNGTYLKTNEYTSFYFYDGVSSRYELFPVYKFHSQLTASDYYLAPYNAVNTQSTSPESLPRWEVSSGDYGISRWEWDSATSSYIPVFNGTRLYYCNSRNPEDELWSQDVGLSPVPSVSKGV